MESYITRRAEHTTDKAYYTLKEDLITMAKQKAFDLDANAIIHAKLSIKKGKYLRILASVNIIPIALLKFYHNFTIWLQNGSTEDGAS